jgi:hypothetical protein
MKHCWLGVIAGALLGTTPAPAELKLPGQDSNLDKENQIPSSSRSTAMNGLF